MPATINSRLGNGSDFPLLDPLTQLQPAQPQLPRQLRGGQAVLRLELFNISVAGKAAMVVTVVAADDGSQPTLTRPLLRHSKVHSQNLGGLIAENVVVGKLFNGSLIKMLGVGVAGYWGE